MFNGSVAVNVVSVEEELLRTELAFVPHDLGHVLLDVAVLFLVLSDAGAVFVLGVEPHGRHAVFLLADLAPSSCQGQSPRLIGSSAGVMAVLIFMCSYMPYKDVRILVFNIKLIYIGFNWMK